MTQGSAYGIQIPVPITKGGTGAVSAVTALTNLGLTSTAANINLLTAATRTVVNHVYLQSGAVATGTTTIPLDDTIPQNTEGDEYLTLSLTPKSASNILEIVFQGFGSNSAANNFVVALFQDSTANALAASNCNHQTATAQVNLSLTHNMLAGTTSATTFKIRIGGSAGGTFTLNGTSGVRNFGGVASSSIRITEYTA